MYTNNPIKVIELRNYLLKPGTQNQFIDYFETHFIDSQNELGGYPLRQFRIKDIEDRFFWIRGFENMDTRSKFLPAFYGGAVWKEFGPAANDMMLEWHNVHLLKPLPGDKNINRDVFAGRKGITVIDYYTARDGRLDELINFLKTASSFLQSLNIYDTTLWISEMTENDFPRLPVIQDKNMLVVITNFKDESEYQLILQRLGSGAASETRIQQLISSTNTLILYPTDKSY